MYNNLTIQINTLFVQRWQSCAVIKMDKQLFIYTDDDDDGLTTQQLLVTKRQTITNEPVS